MTTAADIAPDRAEAIRHHLRAIEALLGGNSETIEAPVSNPRSPADLDDMHLPEGAGVDGPDWTDIPNAIHETKWSESWLRKYRYKLGVFRGGVWYLFRPRLALFPKPAPTAINLPARPRVKSC